MRLLDLVGLLAFTLAALVALLGWRRSRARTEENIALWRSLVAPLARFVQPTTEVAAKELEIRLEYAGRRGPGRSQRFLEERAIALLLGVLLGLTWVLLQPGVGGFFMFVLSLVVGWVLPDRLLDSRAAARASAVARELPSAVDLMVTCLDAGQALGDAIARVGSELRRSPVLAQELRVTANEAQAGVPLGEALRRLSRRIKHDDLASFCGVLAQATALGAPIAKTLADYAEASRRQRSAFLEERAGRMSTRLTLPLTVCLLPASILIVVGPAMIQLARALT